MPTPLTELDALALVRLINQIPSCGAEDDHDTAMNWVVHAGSDACDCGWLIEDVETGLQFIHDHYSLVKEKD